MKIYAILGSNEQVFDLTNDMIPQGYTAMLEARPDDEQTLLYTAQSDGTWVITHETINAILVNVENQWVEEQMIRIANQLLMIEDDDPKMEFGTDREWKDYRISLRDWTSGGNSNFPHKEYRPKDPTLK